MIDEMPLSTAAFHMQCLLVVVTVTVVAVAVVLSIGPLIKFVNVRLVWPSRFKWLLRCANFCVAHGVAAAALLLSSADQNRRN